MNNVSIEFEGKKIEVKRRLGLVDTIGFVEDMMGIVVDEEIGTYNPELLEFARAAALLLRFTNFEPPKLNEQIDFAALFALAMHTDLVSRVKEQLDGEMLDTLYLRAEERLDFMLYRMQNANTMFGELIEAAIAQAALDEQQPE